MQVNDENATIRDQPSKVEVQTVAYNICYPGTPTQQPFDVAVVIPTILRPTLRRTIESVFAQDFKGRIQILIGIDKSEARRESITEICQTLPPNCFVTVIDMGYSTSVRHGGLHYAKDGGALRTILSYLANSRYVAYLDDDNWWDTNHLSSLMNTIEDADWASSLRWFVDQESDLPLCIDRWEATGVNSGFFKKRFGGWVDPNCLMIDKIKCEPVLRFWSIPLKGNEKGMSADRNVFHALKTQFRHKSSGKATCFYVMDPEDGLHPKRMKWLKEAKAKNTLPDQSTYISPGEKLLKLNEALNSAMQHQKTGRLTEAKNIYQNILENEPNQPVALYRLGLIFQQIGEKATSVELFTRALLSNPNHAETHNGLGIVLLELGKQNQAVTSFQKALDINPNYAMAHSNLGAALKGLGRLDDAVVSYQKAIAIKPEYAGAHYNLGNALRRLGKPDKAVKSYCKALDINPRYAEAYTSLGFSLQALGKLDAAIENHKKALQLEPNYPLAHLNLSLALLLLGKHEEGWKEYEWRWKTDHAKKPNHDFENSLWDGTPLNGKTLLLFAEQGLGDTIQFVRYVEEVAKYNGKIIVECQRSLFRLLKNIPQIDQLIVSGDPVPFFDVCAPLLSLPHILGTTASSIPSNTPYLFSGGVSHHLDNLQTGNKNVGISWAGSPTHNNDMNRSISLSNFVPLASIPGVNLFSLQVGERRTDLKGITGKATIIDTAHIIKDFADTAAIIDQLDLIISVDTAVAHLAGAMGKPAWVLLPFAPDFRWLQDRDDTPWYPSMTLFRQKNRGDWRDTFQDIEALLVQE